MLEEIRVRREIMFFGMLHDQPTIRVQQLVGENVVDNLFNAFQLVGRICEDDVEFLAAALRVLECVLSDDGHILVIQLLNGLLDEVRASLVRIDSNYRNRAAGRELIREVARARKKIKHLDPVEIEVVVQNVEQTLLAQVRGRSDGQIVRGHDLSPSVFTADDSHITII